MPRLEQIVAHIANQSASEDNLGQDALKIQAFSDALSVRSQELTTKDKRQRLSEEEEAELNSIKRLQERTEDFLEKERVLKKALDTRPRNLSQIRRAMRDAMQASTDLDNTYTKMKTDFPSSPTVAGAGEFDELWKTETFEDADETLSDIGNYRSRLADIVEGRTIPEPIERQRNALDQPIIVYDDANEYIDETEEPEASDIISAEELMAKNKNRFGQIDAPPALNRLTSQLRYAAQALQSKMAKADGIRIVVNDEDFYEYTKLADKLFDYSTAIDRVIHPDPDEDPKIIQEDLKKVSTLPAFLGQRNLTNKKTNYEMTAEVLNQRGSGTSQQIFDSDLIETADFLKMDMDIRHLNPNAGILQDSTPGQETPDISQPIALIDDDSYFISMNPKEDLAQGLAGALLRVENPNRSPSEAQLNKKAEQVKEMPMFKQLMKDPKRVQKILKEKDYTRTLQSFVSPFSTCPTAKKREVLEKLKMLKELGTFDSKVHRSDKWCNLMDSLDNIDTSKPETYDRQLQSIFDKTEIYQKGKKAIGRDQGVNRRFSQTVNILGILAQAGDAPKDRCNVLVDRTNYVRTRWGRTQPTISLDEKNLPIVKRVNKDHTSIQIAKKDLYQRRNIKADEDYSKYSMLQEMPEETIDDRKKAKVELNKK